MITNLDMGIRWMKFRLNVKSYANCTHTKDRRRGGVGTGGKRTACLKETTKYREERVQGRVQIL